MCARALGARGPQGVKPQSLTTNAGKFFKKNGTFAVDKNQGSLVHQRSCGDRELCGVFHDKLFPCRLLL